MEADSANLLWPAAASPDSQGLVFNRTVTLRDSWAKAVSKK